MPFAWRAGRADIDVAVELEFDRTLVQGVTGNIGLGGLFVATESPGAVGKRVVVRLTLPGRDEALLAEAEVRWVRREPALDLRHGVAGMGLKFVKLGLAGAAAIDQVVRERARAD